MSHDVPELHAVSQPVRAMDFGQLFGSCPMWGAAGPGPRFPGRTRSDVLMLVGALDTLYEHKVKLLAAAAAEPADLYRAGDGSLEFERTASRLIEKQSADYLAAGHGLGETA